MDMIGMLLSQAGIDKDKIMEMAEEAAATVKTVDARISRIENTVNAIALHLGVSVDNGAEQGQLTNDNQN